MVITLLQRADRLLAGFSATTVLADRAFPSAELLGWFEELALAIRDAAARRYLDSRHRSADGL